MNISIRRAFSITANAPQLIRESLNHDTLCYSYSHVRPLLSRVHTRTHVAGYKVHPLVAVNMFLVSATKLSPVCRPSVAGYKGIQVDRDINE